jgi:hypothetical protein
MIISIIEQGVSNKELTKEIFPQMEDWMREVRNLNPSDERAGKIFERIWYEIRDRLIEGQVNLEEKFPDEAANPLPRRLIPETTIFYFFKVLGYKGGFREVILTADRTVLKFIFDKFAEERLNESRMKWYKGGSATRAILQS